MADIGRLLSWTVEVTNPETNDLSYTLVARRLPDGVVLTNSGNSIGGPYDGHMMEDLATELSLTLE